MTTEIRALSASPPSIPQRAIGAGGLAAYVSLGIVAMAVYVLVDDVAGHAAYLVASTMPVVALAIGVRVHRPAIRAPWILVAAGQVAFLAGDLLWYGEQYVVGPPGFPSIADAAYLAGYPALAAGLLLFLRHRRPAYRLSAIVDAAAIGIAAALALWAVHTATGGDPKPAVETAVGLAYPTGDAILLASAACLFLSTRRPTAAHLALVGSLVLLLGGDVAFALMLATTGYEAGWTDLLWIGSYVLVGLAALLPSMRSMTEADATEPGPGDRRHRVVVVVALAVVPGLAALQAVAGRPLPGEVVVGAEIALVALLFVRVRELQGYTARQDRRFAAQAVTLERLATAVEQSSESIVVTSSSAKIEYVNAAFERQSGYGRDEVLGRNPRLLQSGHQARAFYEAMWETLAAGKPWVADFTNRRKDGSLYEETGIITPLFGDGGRITGYVSVRRDVTEERRRELEAQRIARERALIAETIRRLDGRASPEDAAHAICRQVASLSGVVSAGLFIFELDGRAVPYGLVIGGERRPTLSRLPRSRSEYLHDQATRGPWIEAWKDRPWHPYNGLMLRLGVKATAYAPIRDRGEVIGFLQISSTSDEADEALSAALPALVEFAEIATTQIGHQVAERTEVAGARARIRQVIANREFHAVFQPIVDVATGTVVGHEALSRFNDGVPPDVRFAEADAVGLGQALEVAALEVAIDAGRSLPGGGWLNLNVSPPMVDPVKLRTVIARADRPLVLEVTEHAAIADYAAFRAASKQLEGRVRIAIDDAGAGFASLRHVVEVAPAFVKLDRSLVEGIDGDQARAALVSGMAHFAASSGCQLIAEGIETVAELEMLRGLGVTLAQGYLFGAPRRVDAAA